MSDEAWSMMTKITKYLFVFMMVSIIGVFLLGTLCRIIAFFLPNKSKFKQFMHKPMIRYVIKRTQSALITIVLVATATFLLLRLMPTDSYYSDYIIKITDPQRKAIAIANAKKRFGLDKPIIEQLWNYYRNILPIKKRICTSQYLTQAESGALIWKCTKMETVYVNFGTSLVLKKNTLVTSILYERAAVSFVIGVIASIGEILIGYPLGVIMAMRKDKLIDKLGKGYAVFIDAIPAIVYYFLVMILLQQFMDVSTFFDRNDFSSWIVPLISLLIAGIPGIAIWVRRYMVDEVNADYVKFAKAKGLSKNKIMFVHVLRNAIVPLARTIPTAFIFSLMGSYYLEKIYAIPGLGQTLLNSIERVDNPLVQGLVIIFAFVSTFAYLIGDITTALVDPRISLAASED